MSDAMELRISTQRSVDVVVVLVVVTEGLLAVGGCPTLRRRILSALTDEFAVAAVSYAMRCVR
jgi:uncharacterized protein YjeT (DUF2065 family)